MTVTLTDGPVLTLALSDYPGFRTRPQTWEAAAAKFTTLAGSHVADTVLAEIASAVRELEHITVAVRFRNDNAAAVLVSATEVPATKPCVTGRVLGTTAK